MYLKSLILKGFKSFADRSVLSLEPGITAVVGPNGSGKSNISDAVLWVLGERNAKNLRGQAMEDVIFAGSSARKSVGPRRGRPRARQLRRHAARRLLRGRHHAPHVPLRRERVPDQRHRRPPHGRPRHPARLRFGHRHAFHHQPGQPGFHPAIQARGPPRAHRGGGGRAQAQAAQGEKRAQARAHGPASRAREATSPPRWSASWGRSRARPSAPAPTRSSPPSSPT